MTAHVLVPVDGSPQSKAALEKAVELFPSATITLLYVADPVGADGDGDEEASTSTAIERHLETQHDQANRLFADTTSRIEREGDDVTIRTEVATGSPWREIVDYVEEHGVDHVVMGSHGRDGTARFLLGSVAELVVRRADAPVTVVK